MEDKYILVVFLLWFLSVGSRSSESGAWILDISLHLFISGVWSSV